MSGGNVLAGFQVYSFASGMINAGIGAISGDWSGVGAGIGGMVGGAFGWQAAVAGASLFTQQALGTFGAGFITGAIEFGAAGFGAGFGGALAGGASFGDAITAGLITGGVGAVAGGIIQGSYHAGWQNVLHGASKADIARAQAKYKFMISVKRGATGIRQWQEPGHAWFTLENDQGATSYGYWPEGLSERPGYFDGMRPNATHTWDITESQYGNVVNYINNVRTSTQNGTMKWDLAMDCVDFVRGGAGAANISVPDMTTETYGQKFSDPNKLADWLELQ